MTQRSTLRPEKALFLAIVVVGGAAFAALILMLLGVWRGGWSDAWVPYGLALLAAAAVAGYLILANSRKRRRQQRPEWLETQAWRQGLIEKLERGQPRPESEAGKPGAGPPAPPGAQGD